MQAIPCYPINTSMWANRITKGTNQNICWYNSPLVLQETLIDLMQATHVSVFKNKKQFLLYLIPSLLWSFLLTVKWIINIIYNKTKWYFHWYYTSYWIWFK